MSVALSTDSTRHRDSEAAEWRSPKDWARSLGVGPRTIYKAIATGALRASKVNGRDLRVCAEWVREWLERSPA